MKKFLILIIPLFIISCNDNSRYSQLESELYDKETELKELHQEYNNLEKEKEQIESSKQSCEYEKEQLQSDLDYYKDFINYLEANGIIYIKDEPTPKKKNKPKHPSVDPKTGVSKIFIDAVKKNAEELKQYQDSLRKSR
jgi:chromosome segregation ATPase